MHVLHEYAQIPKEKAPVKSFVLWGIQTEQAGSVAVRNWEW